MTATRGPEALRRYSGPGMYVNPPATHEGPVRIIMLVPLGNQFKAWCTAKCRVLDKHITFCSVRTFVPDFGALRFVCTNRPVITGRDYRRYTVSLSLVCLLVQPSRGPTDDQ